MRAPAALVLAAAVLGAASTPAAAEVSTKAPRATLVQVLRGGRQALILDRVSGEFGVVKVGDTIHGLRVAEIEPDQIVLATPTPPERYFVLPLVEAAAPAAAAPPAGASGPSNPITAPVDPIDDVANPAGPSRPGSDVATGSDRGSDAPPVAPDQPEPGVLPDDLAGETPAGGGDDLSADGGDVIDPYTTPPGAGAGEADPSVIDPYGGSGGGAGDIPSIIAPPESRADPDPRPDTRPAPDAGRDARPDRRPDARPDARPARPDARPPAAPPDLAPDADLGDLDAEGGLDTGPAPVEPPPDDVDRDAPGPDARVKTVKPTEVRPGAAPRAAEEPAQPLSRRELDWALSDFAALSRQIRIERADGGGVRIVELERGSFLARLGIKRGDVVRRVAGHTIDTVDQAADAYAALADARDVVVELERRGKPLRMRYRLTR
jgi:hypothetical protein